MCSKRRSLAGTFSFGWIVLVNLLVLDLGGTAELLSCMHLVSVADLLLNRSQARRSNLLEELS